MWNLQRVAAHLALGAVLVISPIIFIGPSSTGWESVTICEAASYVDESLRPVQLAVSTHHMTDRDKDGELLRSSSTTVTLVGVDIGGLRGALSAYSKAAVENQQRIREEMLAIAIEDRSERKAYGSSSFVPHESLTDVFVRRADTLAVSLMKYGESYEGGAHGLYGVSGVNFDTQTGRELTLDDVFTDKNALMKAIENRLRQDYPKASFMESGGSALLREMVEQMVGNGTIPWTLDSCGVTFYFNPYLIGSYMEGIFTATILFNEEPDLFREKYRHAPAYYCMELMPYQKVRTTFAKNTNSSISVGSSDSGLLITVDDKKLDDSGEAGGLRPVLVSLADGNRYLYVDALDAGEIWERTRIYDISGKDPVLVPMMRHMTRRADIPENYAELTADNDEDKVFYVMADPTNFNMSELGAEDGKILHDCHVGKSGLPETAREQRP